MQSTILFVLTLSLLLTPLTAKHYTDLFDTLDNLLCQNAERQYSTIIDIKSSIASGADLLDGRSVANLEACISECCEEKRCQFALFKNEGASKSGKNCYFVDCGESMSNCKTIEHTGFTSIAIGNRDIGQENPSSTPAASPSAHAVTVSTSPPSHITTFDPSAAKLDSKIVTLKVSDSKITPTLLSSSDSVSTSEVSTTLGTNHNDEKAVGNASNDGRPQNGDSGIIAMVIVGVVCATVVVIVMGVLGRKIWREHRSRKFKNVDYLINGMYT